MKNLFIFILTLILPTAVFCQKFDTKSQGDTTTIEFSGDYIVKRDTSGAGAITITLTPTKSFVQDLENQLGFINTQIYNDSVLVKEIQDRTKVNKRLSKDIEKLINKLKKPRLPENPGTVAPIIPVLEANKATKKKTKKRKNE